MTIAVRSAMAVSLIGGVVAIAWLAYLVVVVVDDFKCRHDVGTLVDWSLRLVDQGRPAEAEPYARQAVQRSRAVLGESDVDTLRARSALAYVHYEDGRADEAEKELRELLAIDRRLLGDDSLETLYQVHGLGLLLLYENRLAEAEPLLREAELKYRRRLGENNDFTALAVANLGFVLEREGKLDQAESYEREATQMARNADGDEGLWTLNNVILTALVLVKKKRYAEAENLLTPIAGAVREKCVGSRLFLRTRYLLQLGIARSGQGNFAAAESSLLESESIAQQTHNVTHADDVHDSTLALVDLYAAWDRATPGNGYAAKAADWKNKLDSLGTKGSGSFEASRSLPQKQK